MKGILASLLALVGLGKGPEAPHTPVTPPAPEVPVKYMARTACGRRRTCARGLLPERPFPTTEELLAAQEKFPGRTRLLRIGGATVIGVRQ